MFAERGTYAGWPANHGAWQCGDEMLVGFLSGRYGNSNMHKILEPFELRQARSIDGGVTWRTEPVSIAVDDMAQPLVPYAHGADDVILRVRGCYDHGGDFCKEGGAFYASSDRGMTWTGPHAFVGIEDEFCGEVVCTSRTRMIEHNGERLVFLSSAVRDQFGTDSVFVATFLNGRFSLRGRLPANSGRVVMPAVVSVGGYLITVCRRRKVGRRNGWIEAYRSSDDGNTWSSIGEVGITGGYNGNPPALIEIDGAIVCCYANRSDMQMLARSSRDAGATWSPPLVLNAGSNSDVGYPQLFRRADKALVCTYYWADDRKSHQAIVATHFTLADMEPVERAA